MGNCVRTPAPKKRRKKRGKKKGMRVDDDVSVVEVCIKALNDDQQLQCDTNGVTPRNVVIQIFLQLQTNGQYRTV